LRDTLNAYSDNRYAFNKAQEALEDSLDKAYELYHLLLLLPVEITHIQAQRLESAKEKYCPTSEDLNPNTRFIDNSLVKTIAMSEDMEAYLKDTPINLDSHYLLVKKMLDDILQSQLYADYMDAESTDHARDCDFWRSAMKNIILPSDALAEMLESSSIYWNDDLEIMGTFALKTIRQAVSCEGSLALLPQYKDEDDARFGAHLFVDTINNREIYRSYIDRFIDQSQWDADRLAFMDIVIMMVAVSELLNFPAIPVPVTLNEYIEIANSYSTPRSGQFVNGMLFSIINYLKQEGKLNKN
ncbi:MAG: transcription antitermination protein NusB, partial [Muribaculaceae bacterium]|nr:transcription antitermination protein NusB [Muribaculaceae bacterium]